MDYGIKKWSSPEFMGKKRMRLFIHKTTREFRRRDYKMAPTAGFEPATKWLTATYSTAELCRSVFQDIFLK